MSNLYSTILAALKSSESQIADHFGLLVKPHAEITGQLEADIGNDTINSILRDCRELSLSKKGGTFGHKSQQEEMIVLNDISNIGFHQKSSVKRVEANTSLASESNVQYMDSFLCHKPHTTGQKSASHMSTTVNQANLSIRSLRPERESKPLITASMKRNKSPLTTGSRSNYDEEFSKLFGGEELLLKKTSQNWQSKKSTPTPAQFKPGHKGTFCKIDEYQAVTDNPQAGCDFDKTSCFGGNISVITMHDMPREKSKDHKLSRSKLSSSKGRLVQDDLADRSITIPKQTSKSRGSSYVKVRETSKQKQKVNSTIQDITSLEIESSVQSSDVEMYVPKDFRKKRRDNSVVSKVDHRRDKSQNKGTPSTTILDKQFKCAKIETFQNVMQSLKASHSKLR